MCTNKDILNDLAEETKAWRELSPEERELKAANRKEIKKNFLAKWLAREARDQLQQESDEFNDYLIKT